MNITTVYKAMQKQASGATGAWEPRPYTNPRVNNQPEWGAPEGMSNKGWWGQVGDNLSNWFKQKTYDIGHAIDTATSPVFGGTKFTYGKKRPGTGNAREWGFWDYAIPGLGITRDMMSGVGGIFDTKPYSETQQRKLTDWQKRKQRELNGEMPRVDDITKYNTAIELPNNKAFKNMALQKANDERYLKLRHQGMNNEQIANYIMQEEMLPMMRDATGKQNITPGMQLTNDQMNRIKENMLDQQMAAAQRRMSKVDPATGVSNSEDWSDQYKQQYRNQLSKNFDTYMEDIKNYNPADNAATQKALDASSFKLNRTATPQEQSTSTPTVASTATSENKPKDIPGTFRQF